MDFTENNSPLNSTPAFSAAVSITRPKSATRPGSSSLTNSPSNQIKVSKLVLKPASTSISNKIVNKPSSSEKRANSFCSPTQIVKKSLRSHINKNISQDESLHELIIKKSQQNGELEKKKIRTVNKEKKALNLLKSPIVESRSNKTVMDEATRKEARDFMKKQREKRKLEIKKEVDESYVIKQRLDELRKTTKIVITKKPKKTVQLKISPPRDFSFSDFKMKEIKVLKLKPLTGKGKINPVAKSSKVEPVAEIVRSSFEMSPGKNIPEVMKTPQKSVSPMKKPKSPLQLQNQTSVRLMSQRPSRPSSSKENKKPLDDMKLKVPDVKLSMSMLNKTELMPSSYPPTKIPFWLQNSGVQPYPYNFIWAVRKKLEAYTTADEAKRANKSHGAMNMETPRLRKFNKTKKGRKLNEFPGDDTGHELHRPIITDSSDTNMTSLEQELASEANTISEISSIKSDMALLKSKSQDRDAKQDDDDDTTISESIFQSLKEDIFVGKNRESVNSEFSRSSFDKKIVELMPENVSPNTSEKRNNFLSSTMLPKNVPTKKLEVAPSNDLDNNKTSQKKEEDYQKMLQAFQKSLSHVIEVNQKLTTVLSSKSSIASSQTSGTIKNYSSSFENIVESEAQKTSSNSNISEMIEHLVQHSKPPRPADPLSESNSSIKTFIEDSKSTTLKPEAGDVIEDPPIIFNEPAQEFSSSSTKVTATTTTTTKIVQQKISIEKKEEQENTLNESKLLNMFRHSESETSFNIADNNASFGMLMEKSSTEIKSWERTLIERTRGQIAWLELQKQNFRKHGHLEKVSAIKKQQRAILLRLEKERSKLKENSDKSAAVKSSNNTVANADKSFEFTANESDARENIERILQQREETLKKRRSQVELLINWQRKLDKEEDKLKQMERELLSDNKKKLSTTPRKKKIDDDLLNTSIEMVKSIDKSLKVLETIEPADENETVDVSGEKLNKLWLRLTGVAENLYDPSIVYHLTKHDLSRFYEDAKEVVLQSDLKNLLEASMVVQTEVKKHEEPEPEEVAIESTDEKADDHSTSSTMNSIANIETEEEYAGSAPLETETITTITTTENTDEFRRMMANQMKVFLDQKKPQSEEVGAVKEPIQLTPTIDNATFQIRQESVNELDESSSTVGMSEMDIEQDSLIQTEPLLSMDSSSINTEGFIIPEVNEILITDMDQDDDNDQMLEDISFPNLSISDETVQQISDENNRNLSTITECTEYEQSQGSSSDEISSEIVSHASTGTISERVNSEVEKRLISINDSMEEVNEAFKKIAMINRSPSTVTYSTDKDFVDDSPKVSTSDSNEKSPDEQHDLLEFSQMGTESTMTTSTPKTLMPDILSEVSARKNDEDESDEF